MSIFRNIADAISDAAYIWRYEMRQSLRDEGVLIFFIIVPLAYPLLYSWIYNNEAVHEVPVVVVDDSHSALSRQFIRMCDASPDVRILCHAADMDEAQSLVSRQLAKGIYHIPAEFDRNISRMEQTTIGVYCDMSLMLTYQAVYQTSVAVTQTMGAAIRTKLSQPPTRREAQIGVRPMIVDEVPLFNPSGGYGSPCSCSSCSRRSCSASACRQARPARTTATTSSYPSTATTKARCALSAASPSAIS